MVNYLKERNKTVVLYLLINSFWDNCISIFPKVIVAQQLIGYA